MKKAVMAGVGVLLFLGGMAFAQRPATNVRWDRHPNLRAAQDLCVQASRKISAAQNANEFDMGGHAARAKDLLVQAADEISNAAAAANANGH
jgi:hypothetical protein